jgi:hypothetical protein
MLISDIAFGGEQALGIPERCNGSWVKRALHWMAD